MRHLLIALLCFVAVPVLAQQAPTGFPPGITLPVFVMPASGVSGSGVVTACPQSIAATSTDCLVLPNNTAATAAVPVQMAGRLRFRGNVWNTTVTATNNTGDDWIEVLPVSGATPSSLWRFGSSRNGGATTYPMTLTNAGVSTVLSAVAIGAAAQTTGAVRLNLNEAITSDNGSGSAVSLLYFRSGGALLQFADGGNPSSFSGPLGLNQPAGATSTQTRITKVTAIADNVATDVLTVTIPNGNHAASLKLTFTSSNGSTDAFESTRTSYGQIVVARTTGVNAVATAAALTSTAIATVAAGATHTFAYNVSAIAGTVGASNTFTVQVTIDDSGNLGSNQVVVLAELVNAEVTGITIQ